MRTRSRIAFDWDGTISRDPWTFGRVIDLFNDMGHDIAIVTWRSDPGVMAEYADMAEAMKDWPYKPPIVYCNGIAKREKWPADIWVDDNPAACLMTLGLPPREVEDPAEYDNDPMLLRTDGDEQMVIPWKYLKTWRN